MRGVRSVLWANYVLYSLTIIPPSPPLTHSTVRVWVPPPHETEHSEKDDTFHAGQMSVLHVPTADGFVVSALSSHSDTPVSVPSCVHVTFMVKWVQENGSKQIFLVSLCVFEIRLHNPHRRHPSLQSIWLAFDKARLLHRTRQDIPPRWDSLQRYKFGKWQAWCRCTCSPGRAWSWVRTWLSAYWRHHHKVRCRWSMLSSGAWIKSTLGTIVLGPFTLTVHDGHAE